MKTLVLGLGNDLMSDDGVGLLVARELAADQSSAFDVLESDLCGLALLDLLLGYERAIIIDAMHTERHLPGTVVELEPGSFSRAQSPSPHYAGLPELIKLADELAIDFPKDIRVFAIEAGNIRTVGGYPTRSVKDAVPKVVDRIKAYLSAQEAGGAVD